MHVSVGFACEAILEKLGTKSVHIHVILRFNKRVYPVIFEFCHYGPKRFFLFYVISGVEFSVLHSYFIIIQVQKGCWEKRLKVHYFLNPHCICKKDWTLFEWTENLFYLKLR